MTVLSVTRIAILCALLLQLCGLDLKAQLLEPMPKLEKIPLPESTLPWAHPSAPAKVDPPSPQREYQAAIEPAYTLPSVTPLAPESCPLESIPRFSDSIGHLHGATDSLFINPFANHINAEMALLLEQISGRRRLPPKVSILSLHAGLVNQGAGELTSFDRPKYFSALPYRPIEVEVAIPYLAELGEPEPPLEDGGFVRLLLDGIPVPDGLLQMSGRSSKLRGKGLQIFRATLEPPAPGRHFLQARYLRDGEWSDASSPLYFTVELPPTPQILGIAENNALATVPLPRTGLLRVSQGVITLRLGNVSGATHTQIYLDGERITEQPVENLAIGYTVTCDLSSVTTPGIHSIQVRTYFSRGAFTSELSRQFLFRFEPEEELGRWMPTLGSAPKTAAETADSPHVDEPPAPDRHATGVLYVAQTASAPEAAVAPEAIPAPVGRSTPPTGAHHEKASRETTSNACSSCVGDRKNGSSNKRPTFAFTKNAAVRPVEDFPDSAPLCGECPPGDDCDLQKNTFEFRFFTPAHFPTREFGPRGETLEREGTVVYEGMRFAATNDGRYDVQFVVGTQGAPVTLRLQFLVQVGDKESGHRWRTITLPPITIAPQDHQPGSHCVRHCGYSPALECASGKLCRVQRTGTARVGYGKMPSQ